MKSFASDNYSGIYPDILQAIFDANQAHETSYGDDAYTIRAKELFISLLGEKTDVLFTFNGTGANVVALKTMLLPFQSVLCADTAHIYVDECGAVGQNCGAGLVSFHTQDGKLTPKIIENELRHKGNVHHLQPKVVSISQSTELGTVYTLEELKSLTCFAHKNDMYVHVDGARISNAVAFLGVSLEEATVNCGIDVMSFGGTKNGLMFGEAVLIFNENLKKNASFYQKQSMQLFSKNRFIAAQFIALLENNLWIKMAMHANAMAKLLHSQLLEIPEVTVTQKVESNAVFVIIPKHAIEPLRETYRFYDWNAEIGELRWMCSFDTTEDDVNGFIKKLKSSLQKKF